MSPEQAICKNIRNHFKINQKCSAKEYYKKSYRRYGSAYFGGSAYFATTEIDAASEELGIIISSESRSWLHNNFTNILK